MGYFIIPVAIIIVDQLSKYFAVKYLKQLITYPLIQDVFHLTFAKNTGAAFSILRGKQEFLIVITLFVILFLIVFLYRTEKNKQYLALNISLMFIIGGAVGNLIDRIRLGYVIDYFDFRLINFAIFNVADCFISIGTVLLLGVILFSDIDL